MRHQCIAMFTYILIGFNAWPKTPAESSPYSRLLNASNSLFWSVSLGRYYFMTLYSISCLVLPILKVTLLLVSIWSVPALKLIQPGGVSFLRRPVHKGSIHAWCRTVVSNKKEKKLSAGGEETQNQEKIPLLRTVPSVPPPGSSDY
jgi:hypothetical protein